MDIISNQKSKLEQLKKQASFSKSKNEDSKIGLNSYDNEDK
jgi:hypothetical protein